MAFVDFISTRICLKLSIIAISVLFLVQVIYYNFSPLMRQTMISRERERLVLPMNWTRKVDIGSSSLVNDLIQGNDANNTIKGTNSVISRDSSKMIWNTTTLPSCPEFPPNLIGSLATYNDSPPFDELEKIFSNIKSGGRFRPTNCVSRHRVAIIIPYREREKQLRTLLHNLHAMLARQQIDYGIFVVDQAPASMFNRAMLMNIGFSEAIKTYDYQCFIFHDVDLIPQNDRQLYRCHSQPKHMSGSVDKFSYRLPYYSIFGGVSALAKEQFIKVNGFSNVYFGWGGEDDDMYQRLITHGYKVIRYPLTMAKYRMIEHKKDKGNDINSNRYLFLRNVADRSECEGMTSLKYKLLNREEKKLYTRVHVQINESEIMKNWNESGSKCISSLSLANDSMFSSARVKSSIGVLNGICLIVLCLFACIAFKKKIIMFAMSVLKPCSYEYTHPVHVVPGSPRNSHADTSEVSLEMELPHGKTVTSIQNEEQWNTFEVLSF